LFTISSIDLPLRADGGGTETAALAEEATLPARKMRNGQLKKLVVERAYLAASLSMLNWKKRLMKTGAGLQIYILV
jgi:hypothetical protein